MMLRIAPVRLRLSEHSAEICFWLCDGHLLHVVLFVLPARGYIMVGSVEHSHPHRDRHLHNTHVQGAGG